MRKVSEVSFCRFQTDKTTLPTCYIIKNCALIFREKGC